MKRKAILINDDVSQIELLKKQLADLELEITTFSDPKEALRTIGCFTQTDIDIIITDLYMPEIDGWKLCRLLRSPSFPMANDLPILVLSSTYAGAQAQQISRSIGANHFISLPTDKLTLTSAVERLINESSLDYRNSVLIVEDDPVQSKLVEWNFVNHQYQVFSAANLKEALVIFNQFKPELVILDFHLPDGTAIDFIEKTKAKKNDPFESIYIVMTSDSKPNIAVDVLKSGASAFVQKPAKPDYLLELTRNLFKERALVRVEELLEARTQSLKQSTLRYKNLSESSPLAILELNNKGEILFKNSKAIEFFKNQKAQIEINDWKQIFKAYPFSIITKKLSHLKPDETFKQMIPSENGFENKWLYVHAQAIRDQSSEGYIVLIEDFTDRLNTISQLEKMQSELYKMGNMNSLAELSNNAVFFIKNIISSLKISLQAINNIVSETNCSEMQSTLKLAEKNLTLLPKKNKKVVGFFTQFLSFLSDRWEALAVQNDRAQKSLQHMEDVITAQQQFYSPSQNTTFYIEDFINDLIQLGGFAFKTKKVEFGYTISTQELFTGNRICLAQIILPLLKNSFESLIEEKANLEKRMHLKVSLDGHKWIFLVQDNGPGIPKNIQKKIFYPGYTTKQGSVGNGLSQSFKLAKSIGADLQYLNDNPKGATFQLTYEECAFDQAEREKIKANSLDYIKAI